MLGTVGSRAAVSSTNDGRSTTDVLFVFDASLSNVAEVALARLATQMAKSDAVKSFAEHMIADHTTAQQELAAIALARGIELPPYLVEVPPGKSNVRKESKKKRKM